MCTPRVHCVYIDRIKCDLSSQVRIISMHKLYIKWQLMQFVYFCPRAHHKMLDATVATSGSPKSVLSKFIIWLASIQCTMTCASVYKYVRAQEADKSHARTHTHAHHYRIKCKNTGIHAYIHTYRHSDFKLKYNTSYIYD